MVPKDLRNSSLGIGVRDSAVSSLEAYKIPAPKRRKPAKLR